MFAGADPAAAVGDPQSSRPANSSQAPITVQPGGARVLPPGVLPGMQPTPSVPPDTVVITAGDIKLTAAQFDSIIASLPQQYQNSARGPGRRQFADAVARILVLSEEGRRRKLDQTPAFEVQKMFVQDNLLAGITGEQVGKDLKIDDAELRKYYDAHVTDFEQAKASHILIRMKGSQVPLGAGKKELTDEEALAKAQELRKQLETGGDFAALAKENSDDPGSGAQGGSLGIVHHGQMVPAFEQATFALKPGEISQPIKTQFGYHIIKLESKETRSFDEVKPEIERRLKPEMTQKAIEALVKQSNIDLNSAYFGPAPAPAAAPPMLQPKK